MASYAIELTLMDVSVYVVLLQQSSQDWALYIEQFYMVKIHSREIICHERQ